MARILKREVRSTAPRALLRRRSSRVHSVLYVPLSYTIASILDLFQQILDRWTTRRLFY
jgi:hypothetical protein